MMRTLRAVLALVVVSWGLVLLVDSPAFAACTCQPGGTAKQVERADVVFVAEVDSLRETSDGHVYSVTATRAYKGAVERRVQVESAGRCALRGVRVGREYVFMADGDVSPYTATRCGGTAVANPDNLGKVERTTGEGTAIEPPPPPTATRELVEDAEPYGFARLAAPGGAAIIIGLLGMFVVRQLNRR